MARSTPGNAEAERLARLPAAIQARGIRHNNLRDLGVDVPLWCVVAVAGVSGSGKSSLAMGTLSLRRGHAALPRGPVHLQPAAAEPGTAAGRRPDRPPARRPRPAPAAARPGVRSAVGTMSEALNVLRLIMSRLGTHICPNGHPTAPTVSTQGMEMTCPVCGVRFTHPGAESFAFNSYPAAGRRRGGHGRGRRPVQPARRPRVVPRAGDDRGGRAVRRGQDRPDPGEPGARAPGQPGGREDTEARPAARRGRDPRLRRNRPDPIGQNSRSTPATYPGAVDAIRQAFADTRGSP